MTSSFSYSRREHLETPKRNCCHIVRFRRAEAVLWRQGRWQHFIFGRRDHAHADCHGTAQLSDFTFMRMTERIKAFVARIILIAALLVIGCSFAFAQCQALTSARPRIYLPNAGYGSYATVKDRLNAARLASSPEWQAVYNQATPYLTTEPTPYFYDSIAFEMAMMYAIDPTEYKAYGVRSLHFLYEALQSLAPTVDIVSATNANPTVFTTRAPHGLSTGTYTAPVWGGTENWAAFNQTKSYLITIVDPTHFSVALDSTSFGTLTGKMTVSNNGFTNLNQARWNTPDMAAAWDWAHPLIVGNLTADQINMIENVMTAAITFVATNPYEFSGVTPYPTGGIGNLTIGPLSGALQMAVAFSGDVLGMDTICNQLRTTFLLLAPIYTTGTTGVGYKIFPLGHGGAYVESSEYAPEVHFYLMTYLQTMLGATGENLYSKIGTWPVDSLQFLFHDISPGNSAVGGQWGELFFYGDNLHGALHNTLAGISRQDVQQLAYYLCSTGDTTHCAYAEYWLQNVFTEANQAKYTNDTVSPQLYAPNEFLWYDPNIAANNPKGTAYGTDYLADGSGIMLSRSAWTTSATWVGFKGGALRGADEDHFHPDILTFSIYRNGDWLTNELMNYSGPKMTRFYNVPLPETNMLGTTYEGSNSPSSPDNIFAWGTAGMVNNGSITQYDSNTSIGYVYAEANASTVYRGQSSTFTSPPYTATVNTVIRDFLYLKPDTYVVEDRLAYDNALQAEWNIQALSNPGAPSGNTFTLGSLSGNNALNIAVISPAVPSYSVVTPSTQASELNSNGGSGCSGGAGVGCASQWRVQITSGKTTTSEQYFMVMQSGATGFTPLAVTRLAATNAIAAQFGGYVVMGLTDTSQTGITRSYTYTSNATIQHIGMGFRPSTAYSVDRSVLGIVKISGGTGGANDITTTSGGILLFATGSSVQGPLGPPTIRIITRQ